MHNLNQIVDLAFEMLSTEQKIAFIEKHQNLVKNSLKKEENLEQNETKLQKLLKGKEIINIDPNYEFPTITADWVKAFEEKDIKLENAQDNEMLGSMEQTTLPPDVSFAVLTVADLGLPNGSTYKEICDRAQSLGLELCAQDDGPKLRLLYDQKPGTFFRTAMKQIEISDGGLRLWDVYRLVDGEQWLRWDFGASDRRWRSDNKFIFRVRKEF